jgi:hypothetical protein
LRYILNFGLEGHDPPSFRYFSLNFFYVIKICSGKELESAHLRNKIQDIQHQKLCIINICKGVLRINFYDGEAIVAAKFFYLRLSIFANMIFASVVNFAEKTQPYYVGQAVYIRRRNDNNAAFAKQSIAIFEELINIIDMFNNIISDDDVKYIIKLN